MKGVTGRSGGVRDEWVRGRNAYQLVSDGRPSPSLQCSSDWSQQTSLRIVSAWVKIGQKKGLNRAVCSTGMRKTLVQGSKEVALQRLCTHACTV